MTNNIVRHDPKKCDCTRCELYPSVVQELHAVKKALTDLAMAFDLEQSIGEAMAEARRVLNK